MVVYNDSKENKNNIHSNFYSAGKAAFGKQFLQQSTLSVINNDSCMFVT